jgi:hypothetical protein
METAITVLIIMGVLVVGLLGLVQHTISTQNAVSQASYTMQTRLDDRTRTEITALSASADPVLGSWVELTLKNTGTNKLANYDKWDVILQYTDAFGAPHTQWYPYSTSWTKQIYQSAPTVPEAFEPGILNPNEEMVIHVTLTFAVKTGTTNLVTVGTQNGITASSVFTH